MIPRRLQTLATGSSTLLAVAAWVCYAVLLFNVGPYARLQASEAGVLLEERFGYSPAQAYHLLDRLGSEGRREYSTFQVLDSVNALLMTCALTLAMTFALRRAFAANSRLGMTVVLPLLAGGSEVAENVLLLWMLAAFPSAPPVLVAAGGLVTATKLVLGFGALVVTALGYATLGVLSVRGRGKPARAPDSGHWN